MREPGFAVIWLIYVIREGKGAAARHERLLEALRLLRDFLRGHPLRSSIIFPYIPYGTDRSISPFSAEYLRMVLDNQSYMFNYHSGIVAEHPYSSRWYQWVLDIRPILYYLEYFNDGTHSSFGAFLNPALCWGGLLSLFVLIYTAIFRPVTAALGLSSSAILRSSSRGCLSHASRLSTITSPAPCSSCSPSGTASTSCGITSGTGSGTSQAL